jgi:hypothetical protein
MAKFKVGDKVRCLSSRMSADRLQEGWTYTVKYVDAFGDIKLEGVKPPELDLPWDKNRFKKVTKLNNKDKVYERERKLYER